MRNIQYPDDPNQFIWDKLFALEERWKRDRLRHKFGRYKVIWSRPMCEACGCRVDMMRLRMPVQGS